MTVSPAWDWLARRAELSPDATALIDGRTNEHVHFRAFDARATAMARALVERLGARAAPGERVAVLAENSLAYLELVFACQKLGVALVTLNWRLSEPELVKIVDDACPALLIHDDGFAATARAIAPRLSSANLNELAAVGRDLTKPIPRPDIGPATPWIICYTGGTTGRPKGVVQTFASITANAVATGATWGLTRRDATVLDAPLFHTGGLHVLTTPLVWVGGTSIVLPKFDPSATLARVPQITVLFGVPTMFQRIAEHPEFATTDFGNIRLAVVGGAPTPKRLFELMHGRGIPFRAGYGLTEAGPNNFYLPDSLVGTKPGSVGFPLLGVEARIVDGELQVRGRHVMAGYFGAPEATADVLGSDGWLATGDLARRDEDGAYWIVGRRKDMFISGGENIYPIEIEEALQSHEAVAEVAVVGVPDRVWGEVGVAFVAPRSGHSVQVDDLRTHLQHRLASFKIPRRFELGPLPYTGPGKVDRRTLRMRANEVAAKL